MMYLLFINDFQYRNFIFRIFLILLKVFFHPVYINRYSSVIFFKHFYFIERGGESPTRKIIFFFIHSIIFTNTIFIISYNMLRKNYPFEILLINNLWVYDDFFVYNKISCFNAWQTNHWWCKVVDFQKQAIDVFKRKPTTSTLV